MAKGMKKGSAATSENWFDDGNATALPDNSVPELQAKANKNKRLSKAIWAAAVAGPVAAALAFGAIVVAADAKTAVEGIEVTPTAAPIPQLQVQEITSPGRFAATQALESWLATVPNPLPGGRLVSWDGATEQDHLDSDVAAGGNIAVTLEQFTVVDGAGTAYRVTYQVGSDPVGGGASVLAGPSLQARPQPVDGIESDGDAWPGIESADAPPAVAQAVQTWADAYISGSPERLHLAIGDTNTDRTYVPISGASHVETSVTAGAGIEVDKAAPTDGDEAASAEMIVRAEMRIGWEGRDSDPSPAAIQMDLLVLRADTGAPVVVAWGAPGAGPDLTPYENAVPVLDRAAPTTDDGETGYDDSGTAPEPAPTGSPDDAEQTESLESTEESNR
ncbi:hypothetical protein [Ornithinimicrobium murale]|uniref:hypothetical protein n=1 Tax=Ornithinimicrobium murale TaxID=1050153 RepID=UPI0013B40BEA|nr:hypothetical protein [Ornithinimicrobium murale]